MHAVPWRRPDHCGVFLCCICLLLAPPCMAQMPASVVLVLKLVAHDFVKPATGVVISADGMVMVPADFVAQGDEIVVLDGGTDIIRNGRPAKTIRRSSTDGLAVLMVKGLQRPAVVLADNGAVLEDTLRFAAFPAAEKIAKGTAPLWLPARFTSGDGSGSTPLSKETPLPAVNGALFDRCGYLAGFRPGTTMDDQQGELAIGLLDAKKIARVLDDMNIDYEHSICGSPEQSNLKETVTAPKISQQAEHAKVMVDQSGPADSGVEALPERPIAGSSQGGSTEEVPTQDSHKPVGSAARQAAPGSNNEDPVWLLLGLIPILAFVIWWLRPKMVSTPTLIQDGHTHTEEPATTELATSPAISHPRVSTASFDEPEIPAIEDLPAVYSGMLLLEGILANGEAVQRYCGIEAGPIDVVIGRGEAGLRLQSAAISRAHARLQGRPGTLTLTDLGSSNGTFISTTPLSARRNPVCLAGR